MLFFFAQEMLKNKSYEKIENERIIIEITLSYIYTYINNNNKINVNIDLIIRTNKRIRKLNIYRESLQYRISSPD